MDSLWEKVLGHLKQSVSALKAPGKWDIYSLCELYITKIIYYLNLPFVVGIIGSFLVTGYIYLNQLQIELKLSNAIKGKKITLIK